MALKCKFEGALPEKSACYELDDGTLFLFKYEPPYELSAVVNKRKIKATFPSMNDPLTCAGTYRDGLYFYSTPLRKRTHKFYRATVDDDKDTVQIKKIKEIKNGDEAVHFAHQQPFYVRDSDFRRLFCFDDDDDDGRLIPQITPGTPFFMHSDYLFKLEQDDKISVKDYRFLGVGLVEINCPEPEKTAILSQRDTGFLYVVTRNQLLVIVESEVVQQFDLQCPKNYKIKLDFNTFLGMSGENGSIMLISAGNTSNNDVNLWSIRLPMRYCNETAQMNFRHFGKLSCFGDEDKGDKPYTIPTLQILMQQNHVVTNSPELLPPPVAKKNQKTPIPGKSNGAATTSEKPAVTSAKKVPTSTGKIDLNSAGTKRVSSASSSKRAITPVTQQVVNQLQQLRVDDAYESDFLKNFTPIKVLGSGTFGCVFEAEFKLIKKRYAVKRIPLKGSSQEMDRSLREIEALASFEHPGIVRYNTAWKEEPPAGWQRSKDQTMLLNSKDQLSYREDCSFVYIQMELCKLTLAGWLADSANSKRELARMKRWFRQMVSAVAHIHAMGKIHRDLKPSNILFASGDRLKICDLGLVADRAIREGQEVDVTRTTVGTRMYMAPEQSGFNYTSKVDIFSLGLIFTELCIAMPAYEACEVFNNFRQGKRPFHSLFKATPVVERFVEWLTYVDSSSRPSCEAILKTNFFDS